MNNVRLESVSDRNSILSILTCSKDNGNTVGINSPRLGGGVFVTAVEDVIHEEEIVILKSYDSSGSIMDINKVKLSDIRSVFPFQSIFENPYIKASTALLA